MTYDVLFYGILFLIMGIGTFLILKAESPKISKHLSFLLIALAINILAVPSALFIGLILTDPPNSTILDHWKEYLFVQTVLIIILLVALGRWFIWFIRKNKEKVHK